MCRERQQRECYIFYNILSAVIDAEDFNKHGSETYFKSYRRKIGIDVTCVLSQVMRCVSDLLGYNMSEVINENTPEPNDFFCESSFADDLNELFDVVENNNAGIEEKIDNNEEKKITKRQLFASSKGSDSGKTILAKTILN